MPETLDLPLFRWAADLRRGREARQRRRVRLAACGVALLGLALGWTIVDRPAPRLVWTASASAPVGLYWLDPGRDPGRGGLVAARLSRDMAELAAVRRYLPINVPLVKRVAARGGDLVCGVGERLYVNGRIAALRQVADARGRNLPWWSGCRLLGGHEYLLLMSEAPDSFDGRYFGPVKRARIIARAVPLWVG